MTLPRGRRFLIGLTTLAIASATAAVGAPAARGADPGGSDRCEGVRLLSGPLVVVGIGSAIISVDGPATDEVFCQRIGRRSADPAAERSGRRCKHAQVPGHRLRPRLAAKAVRCLINRERRARDLNPRQQLKKAAKKHSRRMVGGACFAHQCPGEPDLVGRVTQTGYLPCRCSWSVGETLAWGRGKRGSPKAIVAAWMASGTHRPILLDGSFRDVDVGVARGRPGNGRAKAATYTADFGYRR